MCFFGRRTCRGLHRAQNTAAHFSRGFAGERDCQHLLRMLYAREQAQIALRQQLCLARPRGRLDDEGMFRVERTRARLGVRKFATPRRIIHR
jgi:hypothetical protein